MKKHISIQSLSIFSPFFSFSLVHHHHLPLPPWSFSVESMYNLILPLLLLLGFPFHFFLSLARKKVLINIIMAMCVRPCIHLSNHPSRERKKEKNRERKWKTTWMRETCRRPEHFRSLHAHYVCLCVHLYSEFLRDEKKLIHFFSSWSFSFPFFAVLLIIIIILGFLVVVLFAHHQKRQEQYQEKK